jgi:hypothetical protein
MDAAQMMGALLGWARHGLRKAESSALAHRKTDRAFS